MNIRDIEIRAVAPSRFTRDLARLEAIGIAILLLELVIAIVAHVLLARPANAHDSFISKKRLHDPSSKEWCCNHIDCAAVPVGGIAEYGRGYLVTETREVIPYARVLWESDDGRWWRCRNLDTNATRCLIGPPQGM